MSDVDDERERKCNCFKNRVGDDAHWPSCPLSRVALLAEVERLQAKLTPFEALFDMINEFGEQRASGRDMDMYDAFIAVYQKQKAEAARLREAAQEVVDAREWHKGAQQVNHEEAAMASKRILKGIESLRKALTESEAD